jgi:hypothetical protein
MIYGTWRLDPLMVIPDERVVLGDAMRMAYTQDPFIRRLKKGGNLHLYLLSLSFLLAVGYWILTGQLEPILNNSGVLLEQSVLDTPPLVQNAWYQAAFAGRILSVVCGIATVAVVYILTRELDSDRAGLLAALVLAVSAGFVVTAKWATEDVLLMLLSVATLYAVVRAAAAPSRRNVLWVGISAGLTSSAKISGGMLAFPVTLLLYRKYRTSIWTAKETLWNAVAIGVSGIIAYIITTPSALVYPKVWYDSVIGNYFLSATAAELTYQLPSPGALFNFAFLSRAVGFPLFLLSLVAAGWVGYRAAVQRDRFSYLVVYLVPYVVFVSRGWNAQFFRMVVVLPVLAVFVGTFLDRAFSRGDVGQYAKAAFALILVFSLVYTAVPVAGFNTSRAEASEWTKENISGNATVDVHSRPIYQPQFTEETNVTWIKVQAAQQQGRQRAATRVQNAEPDYIVLSSYHYNRFFRDPNTFSETTQMYQSLLNGQTDYRVVKTFGPPDSATPISHLRQSFAPGHLPKDGNSRIMVLRQVE